MIFSPSQILEQIHFSTVMYRLNFESVNNDEVNDGVMVFNQRVQYPSRNQAIQEVLGSLSVDYSNTSISKVKIEFREIFDATGSPVCRIFSHGEFDFVTEVSCLPSSLKCGDRIHYFSAVRKSDDGETLANLDVFLAVSFLDDGLWFLYEEHELDLQGNIKSIATDSYQLHSDGTVRAKKISVSYQNGDYLNAHEAKLH